MASESNAQSCSANQVAPDDETSPVKCETESAKLYLRKFCPAAGDNLYDHLSQVLTRILAERPDNPVAAFEEYSRKLRDDKLPTQGHCLRDVHVPRPQYKDAQKLIDLFKVHLSIDEDYQSVEDAGIEDAVQARTIIPNLFELLFYSEQVDIGLPRSEVVLLNLAIRKLIAETKVEDARFWGKILGRSKNYYVLEARLPDEELERRLEELERAQQQDAERESADDADGQAKEAQQEAAEKAALEAALTTKLSDSAEENEAGEDDFALKFVFPPVPENTWVAPPEVTPEKLGTGANAKVYFVCNSPGMDKWVELPAVTPQQIVIARQTIYFFTGNLETEIHTYPPFPGNEKNYLRAQIARIGAATHVSPIGYFTFGNRKQDDDEMEDEEDDDEDEGEEEEEGNGMDGIVINRHYEQPAIRDLIESSNWCHHSPCILKQGRVIWQDPAKAGSGAEEGDEANGEEDEDEEEEEAGDEDEEEHGEGKDKGVEKEIGPPLLTPLSEDSALDFVTPWTGLISSKIQPDTAVALVRSNLWPGAFALAADKKYFNIYIGWGYKHNAYNYSPTAIPPIEDQYQPIDSELLEIRDPTFEEEEAYRISQLPPSDDDEEEEEESEEFGTEKGDVD